MFFTEMSRIKAKTWYILRGCCALLKVCLPITASLQQGPTLARSCLFLRPKVLKPFLSLNTMRRSETCFQAKW